MTQQRAPSGQTPKSKATSSKSAKSDKSDKSSEPRQTSQGPTRRSSGTQPRVRPEPSDAEQESGGYDASEGPAEAGESMALSDLFDTAEDDGESLSVDVGDLGAHALREAAQQGDSSSLRVSDSDDDLMTPSERSALQASEESTAEPAAVDLTESTIRNGSIFDQPRSGELGQVRRPLLKTNEVDAALDRNERARKARKARR